MPSFMYKYQNIKLFNINSDKFTEEMGVNGNIVFKRLNDIITKTKEVQND
jgi:hypothetical protein